MKVSDRIVFIIILILKTLYCHGTELRELEHYKSSCLYLDILANEFGDEILNEMILAEENNKAKYIMIRFNFIAKYNVYDFKIIDKYNLLNDSIKNDRFASAINELPYIYVSSNFRDFYADSSLGPFTQIVSTKWIVKSWEKARKEEKEDIISFTKKYIKQGIIEVDNLYNFWAEKGEICTTKEIPSNTRLKETQNIDLIYFQIYDILFKTLPDNLLMDFLKGKSLGSILTMNMLDRNISETTFILSETMPTILNDIERKHLCELINNLPYKYYSTQQNLNKLLSSNTTITIYDIDNRYLQEMINQYNAQKDSLKINILTFAKEYIHKQYIKLENEWLQSNN